MKYILICLFYLGVISYASGQDVDLNNPSVYNGVYGTNPVGDTIPKIFKIEKVSVSDITSNLKSNETVSTMSYPTSNLHPHIPNTFTPDKSKIVGEIAISEEMSPTGAKTYNIPIEVASGRNGAQPQLSINYNSQKNNSIVGKGWYLRGLSTIKRGNYSIYYDDKTLAFDNSTSDPFYLDGTRLIKKSSNTSKIVYQSEQGNVKVEGILSGSVIKYFKVWYPNGTTAIFGYASNSSNKIVYPLTEVRDKDNNVIDYAYDYLDNQYRIKSIFYGKNGSIAHFASVHFSYTTRSDETFIWNLGIKTTNKFLLNKIDCKDGTATIRTYSFSYSGQNQSLLTQVNCTVNGSPLNPIKCYYGEDGIVSQISKSATQLTSWFSNTSVNSLSIKKGKFDAWSDDDGLIVYPSQNPYVEIYISGGTFSHSQRYFKNMMHPDQEILVYHGLNSSMSISQKPKAEEGFIDMFAADLDGVPDEEVVKVNLTTDGSKDKVVFKMYKSSAVSGLSLWRTKSFETATTISHYNSRSVHPKFFYSGDFNGDGRLEVFAISCNKPLGKNISSRCYIFDIYNGVLRFDSHVFDYNVDFSSSDNNDIILPFDYNSDGKTDICLLNETGLHVFTFNTNGSAYSSMSEIATYTGLKRADVKNKKFMLGEFNGDGNIDLIVSPSESYSYNSYQQMPVSAPHTCPLCGHKTPVDPTSTTGELNPTKYECQYCNKMIPASNRCYSCGTNLSSGDVITPYSVLDVSVQKILPSEGLHCPTHGTSVSVSIPHYVDNGKNWYIYYSRGNGLFEKRTVAIKNYDRDDKYVLQDMNGDGTTDLLCTNKSGKVTIYPSRKGTLSTEVFSCTNSVGSDAYIIPSSISNGTYHSQILALNNDKVYKLRYTLDENGQSLLTGIINSFGIISKNRYDLMNNDVGLYSESYGATFPYQKFKGPTYLLAETQSWLNNNKIGHVTYSYYNALLHRQGLGFRGFERITAYDQIRGQTNINYYDPLRFGVITKQETPLVSISNSYNVSVASDKVAKITLTSQTTLDKIKGNTITHSYQYNTYGNPTKETINYGGGITTITNLTYTHTNTDTKYVLGMPLTNIISKTANGHSFQEKTIWEYENNRPKTIKTYANGKKSKELTYNYDIFGNVVGKQEMAFASSKIFSNVYTYDTSKRYISQTENYLGQTTIYHRNSIGQVTSEDDFKSNTTNFSYDAFGRKTKVIHPTGEENTTIYSWDTSDEDILFTITNTSNIAPSSKEFFDALRRTLKKGSVSLNGAWTYTDTKYDSRGRISKQSLPYIQGNTKQWNMFVYDSYDRPTNTTTAGGSVTSYSYDGNSVTTTNGERSSTKTTNARGDLVSATDPGGTILYNFRGDGQPSSITAPGGVQTTFTYDDFGRKIQIKDPSAGTITYEYDIDGNIYKETDANNLTTIRTYDQYNRIIKEVNPEMSTSYSYNNDGLLQSKVTNNGTGINYSYNSFLQLASITENVDGNVYSESYKYEKGRKSSTTYSPLNYIVSYQYNSNKHLCSLKNGNTTLWTANSEDAFGNLTKQTYGNGVVVINNYDNFGFPTEIRSYKGADISINSIQHFGYDFDTQTGNLISRSDQLMRLAETFEYDNLDRLISCTTAGVCNSIDYYSNGNIKSTSSLGAYEYSISDKPYAVNGIENLNNAVSELAQNITYSSFKRPTKIRENNNLITFKYNSDHYRTKAIVTKSGTTTTTFYFAEGKYEKIISGGTTKERLYIGGSPYTAPILVERIGSIKNHYYLHRDYLGSITGITNQSGSLEAQYSYTAWGLLRNPADWQVFPNDQEPTLMFNRGYTGHEYLPLFGLINMNARLYSPRIGRFLSPDPYVQAPDFSQNYNRYSYCLNNPLKYTDSSGELFKEIFAVFGAVFSVATFIVQTPMWIITGFSVDDPITAAVDAFNSVTDIGKGFDDSIFGRERHKNSITSAGTTPTSSTTIINGQTYTGYYFSSLYEMVNFMWEKSEDPSINKELSGYILQDDDGNYYYWVHDWSGNTNSKSNNPYYTNSSNPNIAMFDNKKIVGQVHTHPSSNYQNNTNYDGPSYDDYITAAHLRAPVYTIGPRSVSVITNRSQYKTQADFMNLAQGNYAALRGGEKSVNPFFLMDRNAWMMNPFFYKFWY